MSLPNINATPSFKLTIPSTGQQVKFRPFLVKEQKALMLAAESQDYASMTEATIDLISNCVIDNVDVASLTSFDVEYILLQIRGKSVGEEATIGVKCEQCNYVNPIVVDLSSIVPNVPDIDMTVQLTDNVRIKMRWPTYQQTIEAAKPTNNDGSKRSQTEQSLLVAAYCISKIQTEEENFNCDDHKIEEIVEFIESLTTSQFEKIRDFINMIPTLSSTQTFVCEKCGHNNSTEIKGLNNFF